MLGRSARSSRTPRAASIRPSLPSPASAPFAESLVTRSPLPAWRHRLNALRSRARRTGPVWVDLLVTARSAPGWQRIDAVDADGDAPELTVGELAAVARNLAELGVSRVDVGGREPFVRDDLAEIVAAFTEAGIATRLRTAGFASRDAIAACADAGARDIQVAIDTLDPSLQDRLNGIAGSWDAILDSVAAVNETFPADGARGFDATLMPATLEHVTAVVEFAARIGWSVSLAPVHLTDTTRPRAFRAFDPSGALVFAPESHARVRAVLDELARLSRRGHGIATPPALLEDVKRFALGEPVRWRRFNGDVCDGPNLYLGIDPAGRVAPCRYHRLEEPFPVHDERFPVWFRDGVVQRACAPLVAACEGCVRGPYADISLAARALRKPILAAQPSTARGTTSADQLRAIAAEIRVATARPAGGKGSSR